MTGQLKTPKVWLHEAGQSLVKYLHFAIKHIKERKKKDPQNNFFRKLNDHNYTS